MATASSIAARSQLALEACSKAIHSINKKLGIKPQPPGARSKDDGVRSAETLEGFAETLTAIDKALSNDKR